MDINPDKVIEVRSNNFKKYTTNLSKQLWKPTIRESDLTSNFCYPIICDNRKELVTVLKNNGEETRPLIAGSMSKQPFYVKKYGTPHLPNAEIIHNKGLYIPNHQSLSIQEVEEICSIVNSCTS